MERWIANKFGLFNFWYYDEEEFELSSGKVIFRGSNGSGKSVTTQSFIPLLLDGDRRPSRIDPFGTNARKLENYLLCSEEEEDRIGYLYIEFIKPESNTHMTIGMGLRARRNKPLDCWYFILKDGRRINKDFLYEYSGQKYPLTQKKFENKLGEGNVFTTSQREYMEKVNEHLFGYSDIENYKELLNLLIQLRAPKLSKDFKPTKIYEILENSLNTLSEDDLRPMADAMDNMDTLNFRLENLDKSLISANKIKNVFHEYNEYIIYKKCHKYLSKSNEVKENEDTISYLQKNIEDKEKELREGRGSLEKITIELENAKLKEKELRKHEAFNTKDEIVSCEKEEKNLIGELEAKEDIKNQKEERKSSKQKEAKDLEYKIYKGQENIKELLSECEILLEESAFEEGIELQKDILREGYIFSPLINSIKVHKTTLKEGHKLILKLEENLKSLEKHENSYEKLGREVKALEEKLNEITEYLTQIKIEYVEKINKYVEKTEVLKLDKNQLKEIFKHINSIEKIYQAQEVRMKIKEASEPLQDELREDKIKLVSEQEQIKKNIEILKGKIKELEDSKEVELPLEEETKVTRTMLKESNIPFAPFYQCFEFNEGLTEEERVAIEGALYDMGLLEAIIVPKEYKNKISVLTNINKEKFIFSDHKEAINNLSDYLKLEDNEFIKLYGNEVVSILKSIGVNETVTSVNIDGTFTIGIIKGVANRNYNLKYIGVNSRKRHRNEVLTKLKKEKEELEGNTALIETSIFDVNYKLEKLQKEITEFPNTNDLEENIKLIDEAENNLDQKERQLQVEKESIISIKNEVDEINSKLFHIGSHIRIAKKIKIYEDAINSLDSYEENIKNIEIQCISISGFKEQLKNIEENIEDLDLDIQIIFEEILVLKDKITVIKNKISSLNEVLKTMNIGEIEKDLEKITLILNTYPKEEKNLTILMSKKEEQIEHQKRQLEKSKAKLIRELQLLKFLKKVLEDEIKLGYIEELTGKSVDDIVTLITKGKNFDDKVDENTFSNKLFNSITQNSGELRDYNIRQDEIFNIEESIEDKEILEIMKSAKRNDISLRFNGKKVSIYYLIKELELSIEEQRILINDREREIFEEILINTISSKINAKIFSANKWVEEMNKLMEGMNTSSGLTFSLKWIPKKAENEDEIGIRELQDIFQKSTYMSSEQRMKLAEHFKSKLKKAKRDNEEESGNKSYQAIIKEVLDYRKWFEFRLQFYKPLEGRKELTDNEFFKFSGGEKAMAMYVPLFAAVNARYNSSGKNDCPRIIALDEAFAGVDDNNINDMFKLIESLNLDYVLNSQVLWGTYESVSNLSIYELNRAGDDLIAIIKYKWNGKIKEVVI